MRHRRVGKGAIRKVESSGRYPHSMRGIYAYIDAPNHPNVDNYGIHGVSGYKLVF